jgi:hypothetical protein
MIWKTTILTEIVDRLDAGTPFDEPAIHARGSCYFEAFIKRLLVRSAAKILRAIEQGVARDRPYRVHRVVRVKPFKNVTLSSAVETLKM